MNNQLIISDLGTLRVLTYQMNVDIVNEKPIVAELSEAPKPYSRSIGMLGYGIGNATSQKRRCYSHFRLRK